MSERAYDPELASIIPLLPVETDWSDLAAARAQLEALVASMPPPQTIGEDRVRFEDRVVPGPPDAPDLSVRVYRPVGDAGTRPAVLYIHGGGFCFGSVEFEHQGALAAAHTTGAVVVSVEYRLAPEHPFPAGLEDCYAALVWLASQAAALGIDAERIAVMGQSAGGGLSAGLALLARDRGGPALCFQMLGIPELDHRLETASMREFVDTPLWNRPNAIMSWRCYLGEEPGEVSPYASPSIAKDLRGLPPAYVSTMEFDPLRDEGIEYALRLLQAGVPVELHQYPGTFHGSAVVPGAAVSRRSNAEMMDALARALRPR
ncbi:MAG: alpha/beta hydrolase [Myxococcota bacterium]|nr:alpha/beta hydrolase [Myxococcota bacterium]